MHLLIFPIGFHDNPILTMQNPTGKNAGSIQPTQIRSVNDPHLMQVPPHSMHEFMHLDAAAMQLMQV